MHGDRVVARITRDEPLCRAEKRTDDEGRVIRILERAHDTIVGTLQQSRNFFYVVPDDPRIVHNVYVRPVAAQETAGRRPPRRGDKVVVRLERRGNRATSIPRAKSSKCSAPASAPGVDMLSIIRKYHLPTEFPSDVLEEAERIPETVDAQQIVEDAKICATNSSSRSTPTTRAISMTLSMSRSLQTAVGSSACTSRMLPHT